MTAVLRASHTPVRDSSASLFLCEATLLATSLKQCNDAFAAGQGISTYENPIDTHHRELYKLHLAQKAADIAAAEQERRERQDNSPAAKQKRQPIYGAREKCGDAFWWGATYKSWLAKKSGQEGSGAFHVRRKWEKRYFALQVRSACPALNDRKYWPVCGASRVPVVSSPTFMLYSGALKYILSAHRTLTLLGGGWLETKGNRLLWGRNPGKRDASAYIELGKETKIVTDDPKRKGAALRFCVQNPGRVLWLEALNVDDRNDWVEVLQELAGMDHKPAEVAPRN